MYQSDILGICSEVLDKITVIKGYLKLNLERKKVDYSILILQEVDEIEARINNIVDAVSQSNPET